MNIYEESSELRTVYVAGIIDGEGCIGVYKNGGRDTYQSALVVTNANPDLLMVVVKFIVELTGYSPYILRKSSVSGSKAVYFVRVQEKAAIRKVLEAVVPYLVGKKQEAIVMLELLSKLDGTNKQRLKKEDLATTHKELIRLKKLSYDNTEVILQGLRSVGHRNEQAVSPNNNLPTSALRESENVLWTSRKLEEAKDKEPSR